MKVIANSCIQGAQSELLAAAWLIGQGYAVFRNVAPVGPVDLVGLKDGKTELFDVKTATRGNDGRTLRVKFTQQQKELGVKCICVFSDGTCEFDEHQSFEGDPVSRVCEGCGKEFVIGRWVSRQRFCSSACAGRAGKRKKLQAAPTCELIGHDN